VTVEIQEGVFVFRTSGCIRSLYSDPIKFLIFGMDKLSLSTLPARRETDVLELGIKYIIPSNLNSGFGWACSNVGDTLS